MIALMPGRLRHRICSDLTAKWSFASACIKLRVRTRELEVPVKTDDWDRLAECVSNRLVVLVKFP